MPARDSIDGYSLWERSKTSFSTNIFGVSMTRVLVAIAISFFVVELGPAILRISETEVVPKQNGARSLRLSDLNEALPKLVLHLQLSRKHRHFVD